MSRGCRFLALVVLTAGNLSGCTKRTDADVRRAWNQSVDGPDEPGVTPQEEPGGRRPGRPGEPGHPQRTESVRVLSQALNLLASSNDPSVVMEIAERWCEVEPNPIPSEFGEVRVCAPAPPVIIGGISFVIELGVIGVVGLVATGVSGPESERVARLALEEVERMCEQPWTESPDHQFHTCPVRGGSTLAVGRVQSDKHAEGWQVSIAVLGAS